MGGGHGATSFRSGMLLVGAWLAGGLVFVLAVAAAGLVARASTDAGVHSLDPSQSVTAFGTLIIEEAQYVQYQPNEVRDCAGSGDFADVFEGAAIEVRAGGAPVATGTLARGQIRAGQCFFTWAVSRVPLGRDGYRVALGRHGAVRLTEAALSAPIRLLLQPPATDLILLPPDDATTIGSGQSMAGLPIVGDLLLYDELGGYIPQQECAGTGRNAGVGPGTGLALSVDGRPTATARLTRGHALRRDLCMLVFLFADVVPSNATRIELSIAGHGTAVVTGFTLPLILLLDGSGDLAVCDDTSTIQCGP